MMNLQTTPLKMSDLPTEDPPSPFAIHRSRLVPFAYWVQVKEERDSPVQEGIKSAVGDEPYEWCHLMVLAPKSGNGVRIMVSLTHLNSQVSRSTH